MARLSDRAVRAAGPGKHGDGNGLFLIVSKTGSRIWVFRFQLNGIRRDMGLGAFPAVGLADARLAALKARAQTSQRIDPIEARHQSRMAERPTPTFAEIAELVIAEAQRRSVNAKVKYQWRRHLGPAFVGPLLSRPINEITTVDVAALLRPIWLEKPEVGRKLLPALRRVFEHGRVILRDEYGISMAVPAQWTDLRAMGFDAPTRLSRGHHPSLAYSEMPRFMRALRGRDAIAARALEFLILTAVRSDAVLKAAWADLDLGSALWTVPLSSLKDRKHRSEGFRVPLSSRAMTILREMSGSRVSRFIFPGRDEDKPLSNMALLTLVRRMNSGNHSNWTDSTSGRPITPHGFRATFRTWAEEVTSFPHAVVEQAMGHQIGTQIERAYRRTDLLEKRRDLMDAWADYCEPDQS